MDMKRVMVLLGSAGCAVAQAVVYAACAGAWSGETDLLLVTNYEMGNAIYKTALCLTGCRAAGLIIGAKVPIILVSRSDSADSKLASIALGAVIARS